MSLQRPERLHARAALWSLRAALALLLDASRAHQQAQHAYDDRGTVQAWRLGSGGGRGGYADVISNAVVDTAGGLGPDRYLERTAATHETAHWLAKQLFGERYRPSAAPLDQLAAVIATVRPATAAHLARWLDDEDQAARRLLREPDDRVLQPGVRCPACDTAGVMAVRTSAPELERVVVCTAAGCECSGETCGCRMGVRVEGVRHVWTLAEARAATAEEPNVDHD